VVLDLARGGGARPLDGQRVWQRYPAPPLRFTGNVLAVLQWVLRAGPAGEREATALTLSGPLTLAEDAWLALFLDRLHGTGADAALVKQAAVRTGPLTALLHGAALGFDDAAQVPAFDVPLLAVFLEGLERTLTRGLVLAERAKAAQSTAAGLGRLGRSQGLVLTQFLAAVDAAQRPHVATFVLRALGDTLAVNPPVLDQDSLRERQQASRDAAALWRTAPTLHRWLEAARGVRFIDDGYDAAQALLRRWGDGAEGVLRRAQVRLADVDGLGAL